MKVIAALVVASLAVLLNSCDDGYDFDKYKAYKEDGELEDAVHEWMRAYIEDYCHAEKEGEIVCQ